MSFSFSRDRTAELRGSYDNSRQTTNPFQQINQNQEPHDWGYTPTRGESIELIQPAVDLSSTTGFFDYIDQLKYDVDSINNSIDRIGNLHNTALSTINEQQSKQTSQELENIKTQTRQKNMTIKTKLQELENSNARVMDRSEAQMRRTQIDALKKRFIDTIQRYQDVERNYQLKYRQRIERQIRIVKPDANQDEIDDIIDADDTTQVFAQSLMSASRQGQSRAVLSEVEKRHDDIKHIEKTIIELHQLFMDMQMMVEQQGQVMNTIEQNAEETAVHVKEGNTQLSRAIQLAKSTRAKKWCCFFLCIGICVMIAILVWWFGFNHVGVGGNSNNNNNDNDRTVTVTAAPTETVSV